MCFKEWWRCLSTEYSANPIGTTMRKILKNWPGYVLHHNTLLRNVTEGRGKVTDRSPFQINWLAVKEIIYAVYCCEKTNRKQGIDIIGCLLCSLEPSVTFSHTSACEFLTIFVAVITPSRNQNLPAAFWVTCLRMNRLMQKYSLFDAVRLPVLHVWTNLHVYLFVLFGSCSFQKQNFSLAFGAAESVGIPCSLVSADTHYIDGDIPVQMEETKGGRW